MSRQRGDTIIEVMLAIIVLGAALAAAFAISNRATKTISDNQERYQSQLLANQQAEYIRNAAYVTGKRQDLITSVNTVSISSADLFCMTIDPVTGKPIPVAVTGTNCRITIDNIEYRITAHKADTAVLTGVYFIKVEWDSRLLDTGIVELAYGI